MSGFNGKFEFSENPNKSSAFNRSFTMHPTSSELPEKPCRSPSMQRTVSFEKFYNSYFDSVKGKVKKFCSLFESPKPAIPTPEESQVPAQLKPIKSISSDVGVSEGSSIRLFGTEDRVVVYFTSLRGVRRTFEDCYAVRMILRGFRVMVDERDISMDSAYKKELQSVLHTKSFCLPQVFIRGKYIGGTDAIKQLQESGELAKMLKGIPTRGPGYMCESCGDVRFVPCTNCCGSKKVFDEEEEQLKRCPDCNENGLIRCSSCCS